MRRALQFIGTIVFFCGWPAFWVYYRLGYGRTSVVVMCDDKVLVMKQWISPGKWNLPGGGLRRGESMAGGAARELYEETRLRLDPRQLQPVGKAMYRAHGLSFEFYVFAAKVTCNTVRAQRIEVSELEWLRPGELRSKNAGPDTLVALQMVQQSRILLQ